MQSGGHACQGSGAAREPRLPCQRGRTRRRQARAPAPPCPRLWCAWLHACVDIGTAPTCRRRGRGGCKPAARGFPGHGAGRAAAAGSACAARQAAGAAADAGRWGAERRQQQRSNVCGPCQQQQQRRGQLRAAACAAGRCAPQKGLTRPWRRATKWRHVHRVTRKWWARRAGACGLGAPGPCPRAGAGLQACHAGRSVAERAVQVPASHAMLGGAPPCSGSREQGRNLTATLQGAPAPRLPPGARPQQPAAAPAGPARAGYAGGHAARPGRGCGLRFGPAARPAAARRPRGPAGELARGGPGRRASCAAPAATGA